MKALVFTVSLIAFLIEVFNPSTPFVRAGLGPSLTPVSRACATLEQYSRLNSTKHAISSLDSPAPAHQLCHYASHYATNVILHGFQGELRTERLAANKSPREPDDIVIGFKRPPIV